MIFQISLKAARVNADKTQKDAANHVGVSNSTMVSWESGKSTPRADQLRALCEFYNVPIDAIFLPSEFTKSER